jgi:hypothetical protein
MIAGLVQNPPRPYRYGSSVRLALARAERASGEGAPQGQAARFALSVIMSKIGVEHKEKTGGPR